MCFSWFWLEVSVSLGCCGDGLHLLSDILTGCATLRLGIEWGMALPFPLGTGGKTSTTTNTSMLT